MIANTTTTEAVDTTTRTIQSKDLLSAQPIDEMSQRIFKLTRRADEITYHMTSFQRYISKVISHEEDYVAKASLFERIIHFRRYREAKLRIKIFYTVLHACELGWKEI